MRKFTVALVITTLVLSNCSSRQDQSDALRAAERIHTLLKNRDFAAIYGESSDSFKEDGEESKFVLTMMELQEKAGALQNVKAVAYQSTVDSVIGLKHVLIFDLEFERARGRERLLFTRTKSGEMRLWDIVIEPVS